MQTRNVMALVVMSVSSMLTVACDQKQDNKSFLFVADGPPSAPVIISPTTAPTFTSYSAAVHIVGCYRPSCKSNTGNWTVQSSGAGTLATSTTNFTFDANMTSGEVRVFSFTFTSQSGLVSQATTLTITYDASVLLNPVATLFLGGSSNNSPLTSGNGAYKLDFLTTLPSLANTEISSGGFVLSSGALNPQ